ncbi:Threonine synthase [Pseudomonas yamanorum]|nr:Threonine synthase [Pseudomonas yamanorum]
MCSDDRQPSTCLGGLFHGSAGGASSAVWGYIRYLGNGRLWFRSYSGSLLKSAKVSKTLLPHHSAPRLGSECPHSGFGPWAAAMGHPWPSAANPASCRVTHAPKPAFGQRGLTGRLRSRSKADQQHSGLPAGLSVEEQNQKLKRARSNVGAGLPAMASPRCI